MRTEKKYTLIDFTEIYPGKLLTRDEIIKNPGYPEGDKIYKYCCNLLGHVPKYVDPIALKPREKFDYRTWDVLRFEPNEEGYNKYNNLIDELGKYKWNQMNTTKSGAPSKVHFSTQALSFVVSNTRTDLWISFNNGRGMHVIFGTGKGSNGYVMSGSEAYRRFCELAKKIDNYDLEECAISKEEGDKLHDSFPKGHTYKVEANYELLNEVLDNCYEIDINSSFPFGMKEYAEQNNIPVVNTIDYIYDRKKNAKGKDDKAYAEYKAITNLTCGMFWSEIIDRKHADFSAYAVKRNNDRLEALKAELEANGYIWVAYATDAIWYWDYQNKGEYVNSEFGKELGQLKSTHAKRLEYITRGKYQWEDDEGVTHAVLRGRTKYDEIKSRELWEWDEIKKAGDALVYDFDFKTGKMKQLEGEF